MVFHLAEKHGQQIAEYWGPLSKLRQKDAYINIWSQINKKVLMWVMPHCTNFEKYRAVGCGEWYDVVQTNICFVESDDVAWNLDSDIYLLKIKKKVVAKYTGCRSYHFNHF